MKSINLSITILLVSFLTTFSFGQAKSQGAVKESFNKYKTAILNDKGDEAVNYVDSRSIAYYGKILELVKSADSASVEKLSLFDKLMVLIIRHRTSRENILKFDGKSLLVFAIKSGMVGKNSVSNNTIGDVTINDSFAKAELISHGQKTPLFMHFYKEDNIWKMDLTALFPMSNMAFKKLIEESGEKENDYIFKLLESLTGRRPNSEIWQPIK
jgi:hypothetical protein